MNELKIEYLPIDSLKPYEQNARKHTEQDIAAIVSSIEEFGFDDPIGIWGDNNIIVEGHGRLLAAKRLGLETVPVIRLDHLTEEQRRAYGLAHNKTAELSTWDFGKLELELSGLASFNMSNFGFGFSSSANFVPEYGAGDNYNDDGSDYPEADDVDDIMPISEEELKAYEQNAEEFLAKRRIIITFLPEQEDILKELVNITDEKLKVVYDIEELLADK